MFNLFKFFKITIIILFFATIFLSNQSLAVTTAAATTGLNLFKNLEKKFNKQEIIKEPVILNDRVLFYIGERNLIDAKNRALNIKIAIKTGINNNLCSSDIRIVRYNDTYTIKLKDENLTTITNLDTKVNDMSAYRLARTWQRFIQGIFRCSEAESINNIIIKSSVVFCLLLIMLLLIKLLKKRIFDYSIKTIKHLTNFFNLKEKTEEDQLKTDEKFDAVKKDINKLINFIALALQILLVLAFLNYLIYVIPNMPDFLREFSSFETSILEAMRETLFKWFVSDNTWQTIGKILFIIVFLYILLSLITILSSISNKVISILFEETPERIKRIQTISKIISTTVKIILISLGIIIILGEIGLNITPILAGAGIIGLAVSFGGQSLVKDIINGFFIVTENQFGIGDIVDINNLSGSVENMTLRITTLRDLSGRVHIIPNGSITNVTVYTKGWARANLDILISYKEDIDKAISIIKEVAEEMKKEFPDKIIAEPQVLGVDKLADAGIVIKIVIDTAPAEQWFIEREYRRRIKSALEKNNLEIPFFQKILYTNIQQ